MVCLTGAMSTCNALVDVGSRGLHVCPQSYKKRGRFLSRRTNQKGREVSRKTALSPPCECISAISVNLSYSTHTQNSSNKKREKKADYILYISVVVFLCCIQHNHEGVIHTPQILRTGPSLLDKVYYHTQDSNSVWTINGNLIVNHSESKKELGVLAMKG